jgi:hypothetical protein
MLDVSSSNHGVFTLPVHRSPACSLVAKKSVATARDFRPSLG